MNDLNLAHRVGRVLAGVWLGSAVFLAAVAAPAAFRNAPSPADAANVVGAMLTRWHYIAIGLPLMLFALRIRRARLLPVILLVAALIFAAGQIFADLRVRAIRGAAAAPIHSLSTSSPVRRQFGMLHGVSMLLLLGQILAAASYVASEE